MSQKPLKKSKKREMWMSDVGFYSWLIENSFEYQVFVAG